MNFDIVVNKYLLMWHILFGASITKDIHSVKQTLFNNKRKEYVTLQKEKDNIINDLENYIPDDDVIFDELENDPEYKKLKQETNRYRLMILEIWDKNKRLYLRELGKILKYDFKDSYTICVVHPLIGVSEVTVGKNKVITIGKKFTAKEKDDFLTYLMYKLVKNELMSIRNDETAIISAIVEFVTTNELYTRVTNESKYNLGKKELKQIKSLLYPYWLMYLGIKQEDMEKYMIRDNIFFNVNAYKYEEKLKDYDIITFINYIIKNKQKIFNIPKKEIEESVETL